MLFTVRTALGLLMAGISASSFGSCAETFENPVIWQDYPDLDVFRVGDVFYYSLSTFAFSPGAPVLKSYDLVNWAPVSHSVPRLNFGPKYDLNNATDRAYVQGIFRYRESTDIFYWMGCIAGGPTYVWTASGTNAARNNGEVEHWNWTSQGTLPRYYYDNGLLIDDDDTMYMAYGQTTINVAQLNAEGTAEVKTEPVYTSPDEVYIEGSRMYKINGTYYIWVTKPADDEYVLKSDNVWGPYERQILVDSIEGPVSDDLFTARNTLTRRIPGPRSAGTFRIDVSGLKDGDRTGAVLFRDVAAYIGVFKSGNTSSLIMVDELSLGTNWVTNSTGTVAATGPVLATEVNEVWLRIEADITPAFSGTTAVRAATFWYSTDGEAFTQLGEPFRMVNTWEFFTGYRFGVFNFATKDLGGKVTVKSFDLALL